MERFVLLRTSVSKGNTSDLVFFLPGMKKKKNRRAKENLYRIVSKFLFCLQIGRVAADSVLRYMMIMSYMTPHESAHKDINNDGIYVRKHWSCN